DLEQVLGEWLGEQTAGAHAHRAKGVAMVGILERRDDTALLAAIDPVLERDLDGDFHRRRSVIREKDALQPARRAFDQCRREPRRRLVCEAGEDHLLERSRLFGNCRGDLRLRVAVQRHPPGRDRIEQRAAAVVVEVRALGAHDRDRLLVQPVLCVRVPEVPAIGGANIERCGGHVGYAASASASACATPAICSAVCAALTLRRRRDVPGGTVGGRTAPTTNPRSAIIGPSAAARSASPTRTGTMCDVASPMQGTPSDASDARRLAAFSARRVRRSGSARAIRSPSRAAAACAGIGAVEKTNERARLTKYACSVAEPRTNAPATPNALPSVPTTTSGLVAAPCTAVVPRPSSPTAPTAWASST